MRNIRRRRLTGIDAACGSTHANNDSIADRADGPRPVKAQRIAVRHAREAKGRRTGGPHNSRRRRRRALQLASLGERHDNRRIGRRLPGLGGAVRLLNVGGGGQVQGDMPGAQVELGARAVGHDHAVHAAIG